METVLNLAEARAEAVAGWRARLGPRSLLLGGLLIAAVSAFTSSVRDPDFWWHLRIAQWMVDHHRLPAHDLFTYTVAGHTWTDHEYITELLMWLGYHVGGLAAISVGFGVVTWLGFYAVYRTCRPGERPYVIVALCLLLGLLAANPIWGPRAQMLEFAFAALLLYWMEGFLSGRSRAIRWFPLVMVAWANMHGSFVVAYPILAVALIAEGIGWARQRSDGERRGRIKVLALVLLGSLLAMLVTPHGPGFVLYPLQTQASTAQQQLIQEWASPNFHLTYMRPFELMLVLLVAGFALHRPTPYQLLLSLTAVALALESQRHISLFVAACTPPLVASWSGVWQELRKGRRWGLGRAPVTSAMAAITVVALVVIAGATGLRVVGALRSQPEVTASEFPVGAANWLAAHPAVGSRMYNEYRWGGYLIDRFYPAANRRVFIFGEAELMGDPMLYRYQNIATLEPGWKSLLDRYRVDYVVFNANAPLSQVLLTEPGWHLAYQDRLADIFVRQPQRGT